MIVITRHRCQKEEPSYTTAWNRRFLEVMWKLQYVVLCTCKCVLLFHMTGVMINTQDVAWT